MKLGIGAVLIMGLAALATGLVGVMVRAELAGDQALATIAMGGALSLFGLMGIVYHRLGLGSGRSFRP